LFWETGKGTTPPWWTDPLGALTSRPSAPWYAPPQKKKILPTPLLLLLTIIGAMTGLVKT